MTKTLDDKVIERERIIKADIDRTAKEIAQTLRRYDAVLNLDYERRLEDIGSTSHHGAKDEIARLTYVPEKDIIQGKVKVDCFQVPRGGIYSVTESSRGWTDKSTNVHLSLDNLAWLSSLLDLKRLGLFVNYQIALDKIAPIVVDIVRELSKGKKVNFVEIPARSCTYKLRFSPEQTIDGWGDTIPGNRISLYTSPYNGQYTTLSGNLTKKMASLIEDIVGVEMRSTAKPKALIHATEKLNEFLEALQKKYA
jgi:hypothetical protein